MRGAESTDDLRSTGSDDGELASGPVAGIQEAEPKPDYPTQSISNHTANDKVAKSDNAHKVFLLLWNILKYTNNF